MPLKTFPLHRQLRIANLARVLQAVARGACSKRAVQAATGLSWGAVSEYINLLAARRIIAPAPVNTRKKGPGRTTSEFIFHQTNYLVVGMEVGVNAVYTHMITLNGSAAGRVESHWTAPLTRENLHASLWRAFTQACNEMHLTSGNIAALVFSLTGAVDTNRQAWLESVHIPAVKNVSFQRLQDRLPRTCTVYLEHDIKARARAILSLHQWDDRNYAFLQFTRGIGLAVHHQPGFYTSSRGLEGEIGHVPYPAGREGRKCNCGKTDCLETYLSTQGIMRFAQKTATDARIGAFTDIEKLPGNEKEAIYSRYLLPLLEYTGVMVVNLFDPHTLIMGGEAIAPWQERLQKDFLKDLQGRTNLGAPAAIRFYQDSPGISAYGAALGKIDAVIDRLAGQLAGAANEKI
jgi:predicted NBD/HSP70 family sugar kinase